MLGFKKLKKYCTKEFKFFVQQEIVNEDLLEIEDRGSIPFAARWQTIKNYYTVHFLEKKESSIIIVNKMTFKIIKGRF